MVKNNVRDNLGNDRRIPVAIVTFGCTLNKADSEMIAEFLDRKRFELVDNVEDVDKAEIVIVNTCTVKTPTDTKIKKYVKRLITKGKKVVLAGCLVQAQPELIKKEFFLEKGIIGAIGTTQQHRINEAILENKIILGNDRARFPVARSFRFSSFQEIVPIARGCLGNCSYCLTKLARGDLVSIPKDIIIFRIKHALEQGVKEIWLTAEDTFVYGLDINESLYDLLKGIDSLPGKFFVRLGMGNPRMIKVRKDELMKIVDLMLNSEKFYKFLHMPIQSGNNRILGLMNRGYMIDEVEWFFHTIKELGFTVSTDIICGFPTETEDEFRDSIEFVKRIKPDYLNISRFWPRPKTLAAKLPYSGKLTKERSSKLKLVFDEIALENNNKWLNKESVMLINEKTNNGYVGRNIYYKPIFIYETNIDHRLIKKVELGRFVKVKIIEARNNYLVGKLLKVYD